MYADAANESRAVCSVPFCVKSSVRSELNNASGLTRPRTSKVFVRQAVRCPTRIYGSSRRAMVDCRLACTEPNVSACLSHLSGQSTASSSFAVDSTRLSPARAGSTSGSTSIEPESTGLMRTATHPTQSSNTPKPTNTSERQRLGPSPLGRLEPRGRAGEPTHTQNGSRSRTRHGLVQDGLVPYCRQGHQR